MYSVQSAIFFDIILTRIYICNKMYLVIQSIWGTGVNALNGKYETQMKKGLLDMLVLKLLEKQEKYGYQIISELRERSEGRFSLKEGTLYPVLYRLEEDHLIKSKWSEASGKRVPRKYYVITDQGLQDLKEIEALWRDIYHCAAEIMEGDGNE